MTREEAKELLPIMQAFAEGKTIEYREYDGEWKEARTPTWNSRFFTASSQNQSTDPSRHKKSVGTK